MNTCFIILKIMNMLFDFSWPLKNQEHVKFFIGKNQKVSTLLTSVRYF